MSNQTILAILDGVGIASKGDYNAVSVAKTPSLNMLWEKFPSTFLQAAGAKLGMAASEAGTTETAHKIISAGKVIPTSRHQIDLAIREDTFADHPQLISAIRNTIDSKGKFHIIAGLDESKEFADFRHLESLLTTARSYGFNFNDVYVHLIGVSQDEDRLVNWVEFVNDKCVEIGLGRVASVTGAEFFMPYNQSTTATKFGVRSFLEGEANEIINFRKFAAWHYGQGGNDYSFPPTKLIRDEDDEAIDIRENDLAILANFTSKNLGAAVSQMHQHAKVRNIKLISLSGDEKIQEKINVLFPVSKENVNLSTILSENGFTQAKIAESDKLAAVTDYFNHDTGGPLPGESFIEVPRGQTGTVAANNHIITEQVIKKLQSGTNFIVANYSVVDKNAHTGEVGITAESMQFVDSEIGKLIEAANRYHAQLIITADHGNAEKLWDEKLSRLHKSHTINQVPLSVFGNNLKHNQLITGSLTDIAPTVLSLFNLKAPVSMSGRALLT